jgi:hypothetical protein
MAIDLKYGRVQLERGTIGEDEAVVVFRAQDETLPEVLAFYRALCAKKDSPARHLAAIDDATEHVKTWQADHHTQVPQSANYSPRD